ncbi:MAG: hypothetical protein KatS3mg094_014 [Candidatus Parcubacteria bacterium]|nr:MAG: hypothetical protein KatS3mg094_014 [Candidatus Parcubacteria bacterium]
MVKIIKNEDKDYYQCEECQYFYENEVLAKECEDWCQKYKSCNLEIIKQAVKLQNNEENENNLNENNLKQKLNLKQLLIGILIGVSVIFILTNFTFVKIPKTSSNNSINNQLIQQIIAQVLPQEGFKTRIVFGDAVKKMIDCGVIDLEKMTKLYNGKVPEYIQKLIEGSNEPIVINQETANYLLNLFWPLGLSNKTEFNKNIPFSEKDLPHLASTGGWWLGKKENGAEYFNKCEIIKLTPQQEEIVYRVAQNTFRPCCDNSTFAQDCNHGSALLGALELAASQGYSEDELYKLALQLNSFWFPQNYIKIALYKKLVEGKDWQNVDPKEIMSAKFSSISGYIQNVEKKLANVPNIPSTGAGCGL